MTSRSESPSQKPAARSRRQRQGTASRGTTWQWPTILAGAALVAMVVVAYAPALGNQFIWDDDYHVTANTTLHNFDGLRRIWFEYAATPQYYPFVHSSFWIEYHLWGDSPKGYHLMNVLLHAASTVLLWRLLVRLRVPGAWLAAALFGVHPIEVESVAWVTERKNVLSLMLALTSLLCYFQFEPPEDTGEAVPSGRGLRRWYLAAFGLFVAALLSKTVVCTLPAVVLVVLWWKRGWIDWRDILPLLPMFVLGLGLGILTVIMEATHVGARGEDWDFSLLERILMAGRICWFYAGKLAWPYPLIFFYPRWTIDAHSWWQYLFPVGAVALLVVLWLARGRLGRGPLAAALVFGGVLVPALGFFNVYPFRFSFVADHFQYHAGIALLALAAAGATISVKRLPPGMRTAGQAAGGLLLAILTVLTMSRAPIFHDEEILNRDTIAQNPTAWMAYSNLAAFLEAKSEFDEAYALYKKAAELHPNDPLMQCNVGHVYLKLGVRDGFGPGQLDEALKHLEKAVEMAPSLATVHERLGYGLIIAGRVPDAIAQYQTAVQLAADNAGYQNDLGVALAKTGRQAEAVEHFELATRLNNDNAEYAIHLALAYAQTNRRSEAIAAAEHALALSRRQKLDERAGKVANWLKGYRATPPGR
jgi:protein O-mannosyl-transferase